MGEILADTGLAGEDVGERRRDVGGAGVILEVGLYTRGQLARRLQDGTSRGEGLRAIGTQRLDTRHERRFVDELAGLDVCGKSIAEKRSPYVFPGWRRGGRRRLGKAYIDFGPHLDVEARVRLVDPVDVDEVAEMVDVLRGERRQRVGDDADRVDLLSGKVAGAQVRDVVCRIHRAGVGVGRAVREKVVHAQSPPEEPTAWAAGTWEK